MRMKAIILSIIIACAVSANAQDDVAWKIVNKNLKEPNFAACEKSTCVAAGSNCTTDGGDVCAANSVCVDNVCEQLPSTALMAVFLIPKDFNTKDCVHDSDCDRHLLIPARYENVVCTKEKKCRQLYVDGDTCSESDDCLGASTCESGTCVGLKAKDECDLQGECQWGMSCLPANNQTKECTKWKEFGATCSNAGLFTKACGPMSECFQQKCVELYSKARGTECGTTGSALCAEGLTCARQKNAEKPNTCQSLDFDFRKECKTKADCEDFPYENEDGLCSCDVYSGKMMCNSALASQLQYDVPCRHVTIDIEQCAINNNCVGGTEIVAAYAFHDGNVCLWKHCENDLLRLENCHCSTVEDVFGEECSAVNELHCAFVWLPWFTVLVVAGSVLLIGFTVAIVWCCVRGRKKQRRYEAI